MKTWRIGICFVVVTLFALCASVIPSEAGTPSHSRVFRLEPDSGRPGDIITAYGEQLGSARIQELLLTDGECTSLVTIIQQNEVSIRFRIPARLAPGRYKVVILPSGRYPQGVEQQVVLRVL